MRGVAHTEEVQLGKGRHKRNAVVVTELPYQLSKAGWIEKLADLVNDGKLAASPTSVMKAIGTACGWWWNYAVIPIQTRS